MSRTIDVTNREEMETFISEVNSKRPLDLVIANAGISPVGVPAHEALKTTTDVNLTGTLNTLIPAITCMLQRPGGPSGHVVIMSSLTAIPKGSVSFAGKLSQGMMPYAWTKHNLLTLAKGLRAEYHPWLKVTTICPGLVMSDLTRAYGKVLQEEEALGKLAISPDEAAEEVIRGLEKGKAVISFPSWAVVCMKMMDFMPHGWVAKAVSSRLPGGKKEETAHGCLACWQ